MYFWERKNGIRDSDEKCGMRDSREKEGGMRDQDPPFQTLSTRSRLARVKGIRILF